MRRGVMAVALAVAVAFLAGCASSDATRQAQSGDEKGYVAGSGTVTEWPGGQRGAPIDVVGTTFDGANVDLAQYRGTVVVLNFWYAACPPCRAEAPDLAAMANDYAANGDAVTVLGVNSTDDAATAAAFQRTFAIPFPSLDDRQGKIVAAFEGKVALQAVPTTIILDPTGAVAARVLGKVDRSTLDALVDDVLGLPSPSPTST